MEDERGMTTDYKDNKAWLLQDNQAIHVARTAHDWNTGGWASAPPHSHSSGSPTRSGWRSSKTALETKRSGPRFFFPT